MGCYDVIQEHDHGPDEVLARGFPDEASAWRWAVDYAVYYIKRYRRYAFLQVRWDPLGQVTDPPPVPVLEAEDPRPWWKRWTRFVSV